MTLIFRASSSRLDQFEQDMVKYLQIINKNDGKSYKSNGSKGKITEWTTTFQFQLQQKQLNLTIQLVNQKQVLAQGDIVIKKQQFKDVHKLSRKCQIKKRYEFIGVINLILQFKQGLKHSGVRQNIHLNTSRYKLKANYQRNQQLSNVKQGMNPLGPNTQKNIQNSLQKANKIKDSFKDTYDNCGIIKIQANKANLFSWLDDFGKLSFEFAPKQIRQQ